MHQTLTFLSFLKCLDTMLRSTPILSLILVRYFFSIRLWLFFLPPGNISSSSHIMDDETGMSSWRLIERLCWGEGRLTGTRETGSGCCCCPPICCCCCCCCGRWLVVMGEDREAANWTFWETDVKAALSGMEPRAFSSCDCTLGEACFKLLTISNRFLRISVFNKVW